MLCRCNRISSGGEPAQIGMSACNINASANYMVRHCAWACRLGCKHHVQACGDTVLQCAYMPELTGPLAEAQGHTLLLDVNSNTPGAPPVASAVECCLACVGNLQACITQTFFAQQGRRKAVKHAVCGHDDWKPFV